MLPPKITAFVALCIILQFVPATNSAHIVVFSPISSYSHRVTISPIAEAMAEKGHTVTYISTYLSKTKMHPNIRDYVPKVLDGWMEKMMGPVDFFKERKQGTQGTTFGIPLFGMFMCEHLYTDEEFVTWVKSTKVDLMILDSLGNDCGYGMAYYWKAKVILIHTFSQMGYYPDSYGIPDESSWLPALELYPCPGPEMSFFQRAYNTLVPVAAVYLRKWVYFPKLEALTQEKLGITHMPKYEELEKNTSMIFQNFHFSMEYPRSFPPHTIPIGGISLKGQARSPLAKELDAFISKGDGFIFVSFGSWGDFTRMEESTKRALIDGMNGLLNIQFIFKVSNETLIQEFPNKNVYITNWVPQQTLFTNPKIKAFVTQTGLISTQEAVYNAIPMIALPILAEQDYTAEIVHRKEIGIKLEITTLTKHQFMDAINNILQDSKYRNNMKRVSAMFKERPQEALDTAVFWTEFVLSHSHEDLIALRPFGVGQSWFKKRGLDVWAAVFMLTGVLLLSLIFITWKLFRKFCGKKSFVGSKEQRRCKKIQ